MDFVFRWFTVPALFALLASSFMAAAVYATNPTRRQNRILAIALAAETISLGVFYAILPQLANPLDAAAMRAVEFSFQILALLSYLAFLGTIEVPLSRPFRSPAIQWALVAAGGLGILAWPFITGFVLGDTLAFFAFPESSWVHGIHLRNAAYGAGFLDATYGLVMFYGLAVAASAWRRAPRGTAARDRAKAYGIAFGIRDLFIGGPLVLNGTGTSINHGIWESFYIIVPLASIAFVTSLAYGILKTQLFDIDLKVKWTVKQGTVAAVFIAAFFVAGELAQTFFSDAIGPYVGVFAAGFLVFALAPLQRLAERVSDRAMPQVNETPAYVTFRKMEVYKAAVEEVLTDGAVSDKERRILDRLRLQLGLGPDDARAIEDDLAPMRARA
ncbi:MAG TPA: hypothetical protein VM889_10695 [Candidatus Thermoplasmatota archaeon]|nr:hypothetical protein [Candidatus Thermoplasmatota archaeon]